MADPVVVVTGAAGAIGSALLAHFSRTGHRVVGVDLSPAVPPALAEVVELWCAGDVTVAADMQRVVDTTVDALDRIDVVVANAGITALGTFAATSDEAFTRVMDVNLHGAVRTLRAALPHLRASGGRVVVMSSVAGFAPVLGRPAYVASKHAVTGLFESLRPELAPDGVGVTVVYPGFLSTSPSDSNPAVTAPADRASAAPADDDPAVTDPPDPVRADTPGRQVTGRVLDADDVARAVVEAVRRGHDQVFPGRTARTARFVHRLAPRLYVRQMVRRLRR